MKKAFFFFFFPFFNNNIKRKNLLNGHINNFRIFNFHPKGKKVLNSENKSSKQEPYNYYLG